MDAKHESLKKPTAKVIEFAVTDALLTYLPFAQKIDDITLANQNIRLDDKAISISQLFQLLREEKANEAFWNTFNGKCKKQVALQKCINIEPQTEKEKILKEEAIQKAFDSTIFVHTLPSGKVLKLSLSRIAKSEIMFGLKDFPGVEKIIFDAVLSNIKQELMEVFARYFSQQLLDKAEKFKSEKAATEHQEKILNEKILIENQISEIIKEILRSISSSNKTNRITPEIASSAFFEPGTMQITKTFHDTLQQKSSKASKNGVSALFEQHTAASSKYAQKTTEEFDTHKFEQIEKTRRVIAYLRNTIKEDSPKYENMQKAIAEAEKLLELAQQPINPISPLPSSNPTTAVNDLHKRLGRRKASTTADSLANSAFSLLDPFLDPLAKQQFNKKEKSSHITPTTAELPSQQLKVRKKTSTAANYLIPVFAGGLAALAVESISSILPLTASAILALEICIPVLTALLVGYLIQKTLFSKLSPTAKQALLAAGIGLLVLCSAAAPTLGLGAFASLGIGGISALVGLGTLAGAFAIGIPILLGLAYCGYKAYQAWQVCSDEKGNPHPDSEAPEKEEVERGKDEAERKEEARNTFSPDTVTPPIDSPHSPKPTTEVFQSRFKNAFLPAPHGDPNARTSSTSRSDASLSPS